jgi:hypothetical protein
MSNYALMFLFVYDMFYILDMVCNEVQENHLSAYIVGRTDRARQVHTGSE